MSDSVYTCMYSWYLPDWCCKGSLFSHLYLECWSFLVPTFLLNPKIFSLNLIKGGEGAF